MLEIRHVTKIYKTKDGVETRALDDVSISFAETGMVFLLGKSGSGKSTLLNVSGGLDDPTGGEIIVKGKSSKSFSGADFDSYRNTFVGFVFQEYNVLDEFNVEDNIALALELQGKPKDREKIKSLLEEVDLGDCAKRKPNTLSGGQKQRIAIARALIKDPQIIMADEPTGALDSATGKQVFDTLKKLSENRLVIVVSHDREFAEMYGDRIVELKDGKIISDVTKRKIAAESLDENISVVGSDTLTIKSGSNLTSANIAAINEFLKKSDGDIIITRGEKEKLAFRRATRMSEEGATESFTDTQTQDVKLKEYDKEDSKFIRSRLPVGKAIKIGASGLKLKPIRLFFTVFLSFVAFTMFGLFSTLMSYDGDEVAASSFAENGGNYLNINKKYHYRYVWDDGEVDDDEWYNNYARFTPAEVDKFKDQFGDGVFGTIGRDNVDIDNANLKNDVSSSYYLGSIKKFTQAENGKHILPLKAGDYPKETNEIAVSSYLVTVLNNSEFFLKDADGNNINANGEVSETEVTFNVTDANSLIGKYLSLPLSGVGKRTCFKVVGVFDSGEVDPKYNDIRDNTLDLNSNSGFMIEYEYQNYIAEELHSLAIVNDDFYEKYYSNMGNVYTQWIEEFDHIDGENLFVYFGDKDNPYGSSYDSVNVYSDEALYKADFIGQSKTSLEEDEIIVPFYVINNLINYIYNLSQTIFEQEHPYPQESDFTDGMTGEVDRDAYNQAINDWQTACEEWDASQSKMWDEMNLYSQVLQGNYYDAELDEWLTSTPAKIAEAKEWVNDLLAKYATDGYVLVQIAQGDKSGKEFRIVGWFSMNSSIQSNEGLYVSQAYYDSLNVIHYNTATQQTNYVEPEDAMYDAIYIPYDRTESMFNRLMGSIGFDNLDKDTDVFYELNSGLYDSVDMVNGYVEIFSTVFLWVGVVFAVFASLLMFNFISMSISNKRKEIGILRAVGARGTDVFKIFFAESGIIVGICLVLSVIGSIAVSVILNNVLRSMAGLKVTIFVFGIVSLAMMFALALVVAVISTFLPVYFAARKKPVESIRAL